MSEHTYLSIHVCMFVLDDTFLFSFQVGIYYVEIFVQNKVYFFSTLVCFLHVVELEACVEKIGIMLWTVARVAGMVEDDDKGILALYMCL